MSRGDSASESLQLRPIGVIHSPYKEQKGTPIQGVFAPADAAAEIEVFEEFAGGLQDIDGFSHLYLLYAFDRAGTPRLTCRPYLEDVERGVFATRAPVRPNPIGLSIVRVVSREANRLRVAEVDILDGTPLIDIKPYVPQFDFRLNASSGWIKAEMTKAVASGADDRFGK